MRGRLIYVWQSADNIGVRPAHVNVFDDNSMAYGGCGFGRSGRFGLAHARFCEFHGDAQVDLAQDNVESRIP
jgi:hypothetical protein